MIREKISTDCKVKDMPQIITDYFQELPQIPDTHFLVAGYDVTDSGKQQLLYKVNVKSREIEKVDTSGQGASWDGETFTLTRLIQNVAVKMADGTYLRPTL